MPCEKEQAKLDSLGVELVALLDVASPSGVFRPFISFLCSVHEPLVTDRKPRTRCGELRLVVDPWHAVEERLHSELGIHYDTSSVLGRSHAYDPGKKRET